MSESQVHSLVSPLARPQPAIRFPSQLSVSSPCELGGRHAALLGKTLCAGCSGHTPRVAQTHPCWRTMPPPSTHHDLGLVHPPGGVGQAAGASWSLCFFFCHLLHQLNQIMRACPEHIWACSKTSNVGAFIYYLLSLRSPLRLSLLCQWFQRPQNHPGSFVEDTASNWVGLDGVGTFFKIYQGGSNVHCQNTAPSVPSSPVLSVALVLSHFSFPLQIKPNFFLCGLSMWAGLHLQKF